MQTIQASAAQVGRDYSSPKGVVVTIMEHLPDGQVRVKNKAGREALIPGTHVLVLPDAPSASVADLAGKPRDVLEPALAGLSEADLDALAQADTRAWVQHAIAAELARRTQAGPALEPTRPSDQETLRRAVASVAPGVQAVLQADAAQIRPERAEELRAVAELRAALTDLVACGVTVLPPHGSDTERREVRWLLDQLDEVVADRLHLNADGVAEFKARIEAAKKPTPEKPAATPSRSALLDLCEGALKWLKDHEIETFDLEGEPGQTVIFWLEGLDEEPTERVAAAWNAAVELRRAHEALAAARQEGQDQGAAQQGRSAPRRVREADRVRFEEEGAAAWRDGKLRPGAAPEGWPPRALKALQDGWDREEVAAFELELPARLCVLPRREEVQALVDGLGTLEEVDACLAEVARRGREHVGRGDNVTAVLGLDGLLHRRRLQLAGAGPAALPDGASDDDDPMPGGDEDDPMPGDDEGDDAAAWAELGQRETWIEEGPDGAVIATVVADEPPELLREAAPAPANAPDPSAAAESPADWLRQQADTNGTGLGPDVLAAFVGLVGSVRENTAALAGPLAWEAPLLRMALRYEEAHQRRPTILDRLLGRLQRVEAGARPGQRRPPADPPAEAPVAAAPPAPPTPPVEDTHGLEGDGLARARRIQANLRRMADAVPAVLAFQEAAAALGADGAKMDLGALLGFPR